MSNIADQRVATQDLRTEIQGVKTTRGGMSYDLRPFTHDRRNTTNPMVFYGVDARGPRRTVEPSSPSRLTNSVRHTNAADDADLWYNDPVSPIPRERSMPHLSRRDSDPVRSKTSTNRAAEATGRVSPPRLITVDEWRREESQEISQRVDDPYTCRDPHPLFDGEAMLNADRPRARESNNFGEASSRPGRDGSCREQSREDQPFSDKTFENLNDAP